MKKNLITENYSGPNVGQKVYIDIEPGNISNPQLKLTLLWFDISGLSKLSQLLSCCFGVFVCYLVYGYLLELIFTLDGLKPYGWYVTLMQFGYYSIFGWVEHFLCVRKERK